MLITSGIDSCCVESSPTAIVHAFMNILIINLFFFNFEFMYSFISLCIWLCVCRAVCVEIKY